MKKFTILFVTLLAMSGMAFGQKEGKVLWETLVDNANNGLKIANYGINPAVSPTGNTLVQYKYASPVLIGNENLGVKAFDKNGKEMWNANDFYKRYYSIFEVGSPMNNHIRVNSFYTDSKNGQYYYDSTLYFDGEYSFLKKLMVLDNRAFIAPAENGILYSSEFEKATIKYDLNGKEKWRYPSTKAIVFQTWGEKKTPYLGIVPMTDGTGKSRYVILDKDGKQKGLTEPQFFTAIYRNNDNGFWSRNEKYEFIKFDSTGKQTFKLPLNSQWSRDNFALSDYSLLLQSENKNGLNLILASPEGKVKEVSFSFPFQVNYATNFKCKEVAPNVIMYAFGMPEREIEADIIYKIGVVNFNDSSKSWSKDIRGGASNGTYGNTFTFEAGNTFFQVYSKPDNPPIKTFKIYDINGTLKWESPFVINSPPQNIVGWRITDNFLYTTALYSNGIEKNGLVKVSCNDGKLIWKKEATYVYNFSRDIKKDENGNEFILYKKDDTYKIGILNADGSDKWINTLGKSSNFFYSESISFSPTNDGKLIVLSQETKDNKNQLILRKISSCNDLNTISITANNTEVCPTEKVKLSIPKQDGITYQWQRDGKDIPNVKDAVHDFGESGTYTVVAKDELCQNTVTSNALKINIRPLPTAEITAPKSIFCDGEKTTIASKTNGTFFQWQKDGKDIPNATTGILEVSQAGDYRVGVRDDKCPQVGYSNIYTIITKLLPEATISTDIKGVVYEPFTVKMSANSGTGLAYQWLKDDAEIPNETKANFEAKKSGKYNVNVTYDGCTKLSDALTISILIPLANSEEVGEEEVKVYPNPSKGEFKIILPKSLKSAEVQLFDTFGRERFLTYIGEQAQAEGLSQGVYFLRVKKGDKTVTNKLIIE